ncbi:ADP-ribosylglycohydrolase family protein [Empedobacter falsenii]|uniref:ADP-ribosylglycohydrolase family protein n=1 Tax=Empedobacter falsenii TaxID=343874 RepID=A0A7H9DU94_9FLAO|nr:MULTISPECIES: ADP-ribosylglycohydrolase family protein [Empedobacter]MDH2205948.1 ADP-ribosylglycohydrolase family protein [Empedobacter sp. GD03644]MDM1063179.1 ADP-ribosylglycohydrolase family protein [Empedobacter falsenii]QLL58762.1 ADP-ribosylglycohydrolase family protein [Empedobacter falsenii]
MNRRNFSKNILIGSAVGDALGVPVEFKSRQYLQQNPVTDMMGYGTYNMPPGTFSDDSSMMFCLAESLCNGYNVNDIAEKFQMWMHEGYWTADGEVFDVGISTRKAINRLRVVKNPTEAGSTDESDNGNGSLMRILPLAIFTKDLSIDERCEIVKEVSSITHAHNRSVLACIYYIEFALNVLDSENLEEAYLNTNFWLKLFLEENEIYKNEFQYFERILSGKLIDLKEDEIKSTGYVMDSLEASIWCLLHTDSYKDCVLKAVNLGHDTDTIACIAGGIAGIYYDAETIPTNWIEQLARVDDILHLAEQLEEKYEF